MAELPDIPGPDVLVLGAGASGRAAARYLARRGRRVLVADSRPESAIPAASALRALGARVHGGGHPPSLLAGMSLVVTSPGVPPATGILKAARRGRIPVWGELELGYRALGEPADRLVAVTGTKGKSTVVTLLAEALSIQGTPARACGNLGEPLTALARSFGPDEVAVVETSSFQLATIARFRARVAVMLEVGQDHLDWHPDLADYRRSKARLFENQTASDWVVFDGDDAVASGLAASGGRRSGAGLLPFGGSAGAHDPEVLVDSGRIVRRDGGATRVLASLAALRLPGRHQQQNLAAAAAAGSLLGVGRDALEAAAARFPGLPHALEDAGSVAGVRFVNDSRATNLQATRAALEALSPEASGGIQLILGGILKGGRFADLEGSLGAVRAVQAIGRTKDRIAAEIRSVPVEVHDTLDGAVENALARSRPGGVVLLSPGCSSFDLFENYGDRGRCFRAAVERLQAAGGGR
ncbi:MAG: UDP-N-acetylmuramoyl-L-alanine--D-glutamate ligase [Acidobacteria bacterium]|nr:UDP-N-acetylmuramoyl-L-alanine--D-glutamate ligase [Acidobacteriota bacterium]MYE42627.1 UDP-N-acetylmuramoyl-L-alanine--D-glutamate ligase [Acidobacteriota bacterium]